MQAVYLKLYKAKALKRQKNKIKLRYVMPLNLAIDRFERASACVIVETYDCRLLGTVPDVGL